MKLISFILLFSFSVISITPLVLMNSPAPELSCGVDVECCMPDENEQCDIEDMECCPPGMCNPSQCVFCCFVCTVNHDKIIVRVFDSDFKSNSTADQFLLSDFTSDCWQPPELA